MATILKRLGALERGQSALAGRLAKLETQQAGDDQQELETAEKLAGLRTDLDALAERVGEEEEGELPTPEEAFDVDITGEVQT